MILTVRYTERTEAVPVRGAKPRAERRGNLSGENRKINAAVKIVI